jgi:hypothetical protein
LLVIVAPVLPYHLPAQVTFARLHKNDQAEAGRTAIGMTSAAPNPFEALATALNTAIGHMGNKQTLIRYLRNYYFEINTSGDRIVNEMIDVFEDHPTPHGAMFAIQHSDTDLVEVCARHIVEDALTPQKLSAWMACQRPRGHDSC